MRMEYLDERKKTRRRNILIVVITTLVMLVWSAYNSPLFPYYTSGDSSIFMLIGKGITEGKLPYRDLFDHKGPVLFWIEALGWAIAGRTGIWILETLGTVVSVFLIIRICDMLRSNWVFPVLGTAVVYLTYFGRGNLCENYSIPFIYFCVYLVIHYFQSGSHKHPWQYAFAYGVCFGVLAFIRVNNATVICGFVLCIIIQLILAGEFKNLIQNIITGLAGVLTVAGPICLYFYSKGALQEMLFSTFTYNFLYAANRIDIDGTGLFQKVITFMPIAFTTLFSGVSIVRNKFDRVERPFVISLFFVSALCFAELLYTSMSGHYHTIALPLYSVAIGIMGPDFRPETFPNYMQKKKGRGWIAGVTLISSLYLVLCIYNMCAPIYRHYLTDTCVSRHQDVVECIASIPEEERDSVVGYEIATSWYIDSGITPCYKFYSMQRWWSAEGFDVNGQFLEYVSKEHPKWVVTGTEVKDETLKRILDTQYTLEEEGRWLYYRYIK